MSDPPLPDGPPTPDHVLNSDYDGIVQFTVHDSRGRKIMDASVGGVNGRDLGNSVRLSDNHFDTGGDTTARKDFKVINTDQIFYDPWEQGLDPWRATGSDLDKPSDHYRIDDEWGLVVEYTESWDSSGMESHPGDGFAYYPLPGDDIEWKQAYLGGADDHLNSPDTIFFFNPENGSRIEENSYWHQSRSPGAYHEFSVRTEDASVSLKSSDSSVDGEWSSRHDPEQFEWYTHRIHFYNIDIDTIPRRIEQSSPNPSRIDYKPRGQNGLLYFLIQYRHPEYRIDEDDDDDDDGNNDLDDTAKAKLYVENKTKDRLIYEDDYFIDFAPNEHRIAIVSETADPNNSLDNNIVDWKLQTKDTAPEARWTVSTGITVESDHTHNPEPGIIEMFGESSDMYYPEGITLYAYPGDGDEKIELGQIEGGQFEFRESIDATGILEKGSMNRIEAKAESLGNLMVWIEGDAYRSILGDG